jgi:hypothetical protein
MDSSPAATAGSFDSVLLIDRPLPWPASVDQDPQLRPLIDRLAQDGAVVTGRTRVQAVVPLGDDLEATLYRRPRGDFTAYERVVVGSPAGGPIDQALTLVGGGGAAGSALTEILMCTHGKRDVCCGALGTDVHRRLSEIYADSNRHRVRRTSHLGGHRFAATGLVMPAGTLWAWVDADLMHAIVEQEAPIDVAVRHYRGTMGLDQPEVQMLDAALLEEHGWEWLGRRRSGKVVARDGVRAMVELTHVAGGESRTTTAAVTRVGTNPVPACGVPLDGTEKVEPVWAVTELVTR